LAAGLCLNPMGELYSAPRLPGWIWERSWGKGKGRASPSLALYHPLGGDDRGQDHANITDCFQNVLHVSSMLILFTEI